MAESTQQSASRSDEGAPRIELEDLIAAVTRGVARALQAEDEVSGFAAALPPRRPGAQPDNPTITIGITLSNLGATFGSIDLSKSSRTG